jgi:hypothetical protein
MLAESNVVAYDWATLFEFSTNRKKFHIFNAMAIENMNLCFDTRFGKYLCTCGTKL